MGEPLVENSENGASIAAERLEELRRAWQADQVHGAYLFEGPPGTGKHETALAFAALLLRGDPHAAIATRDEESWRPTHADLHLVEPDGAFVKVDQVRELARMLSLRAHEGGRRVGIVFGAEHLRTEAANALLKTLEEPGPNTTLILLATVAARLPATVRSRTTRLRFTPRVESAISSALASQGIAAEDARMVAALASGSVRAARGWAEAHLETAREMRLRLASVCEATASDLLDYAESFRGSGARERLFLFCDVHHAHARARMEDALATAQPALAGRWVEREEAAERARLETIRRNLNPQMVVEGLLFELRHAALR